MSKSKIVVEPLELETGVCDGEKSKDGKHEVWHGLTGESWPLFCVNGCNKVSNGPPTKGWSENI